MVVSRPPTQRSNRRFSSCLSLKITVGQELSTTDLRVESLSAIRVGSSLALTKIRLTNICGVILTVEVDFPFVRDDLEEYGKSGYGRVRGTCSLRKA